jgi:hypothetical protein
LRNVLDRVYNLSMTTKTASPKRQSTGPARTQTGPDGTVFHTNFDDEFLAWEQAWATYNRDVRGIPCGCVQVHEGSCGSTGVDAARTSSKPAGREKTAEEKQAIAEAIAYIAAYKGSWGFILDLRADPKFGTKWFRLSERQVEVVLNAKKRDAASASSIPAEQAALVTKVVEAMAANPSRRPDFIVSISTQGLTRVLSEKQTACLVRFLGESTPAAAPKARAEVSEGWYMVDKTPWKVQHNLQHTGIYAKRLTPEGWEFVPGGLRTIAEKGEPMTREMAAEYGRLYGVCGVCGRELTDETSIEAGIGPVCSGRLG